MSGYLVVRWLEVLGGFSLILQCLEYWRIAESTDPQGIWAWQVQRADIPDNPAFVKAFLDRAYQPGFYRLQLLVRLLAAFALIAWGNHLLTALVLYILQVMMLERDITKFELNSKQRYTPF